MEERGVMGVDEDEIFVLIGPNREVPGMVTEAKGGADCMSCNINN
jgi:hypothetical protein